MPEKFEPKKFQNQKGTYNKSAPEKYTFIFGNIQAYSKTYDYSMYTQIIMKNFYFFL